jgi:hypothetical protein
VHCSIGAVLEAFMYILKMLVGLCLSFGVALACWAACFACSFQTCGRQAVAVSGLFCQRKLWQFCRDAQAWRIRTFVVVRVAGALFCFKRVRYEVGSTLLITLADIACSPCCMCCLTVSPVSAVLAVER